MTGLEALAVFCLFLVPVAFVFYLAMQATDERERRKSSLPNEDRLLGALRRKGGA